MSAIEASTGNYRSRIDGTIVLSIEIEPRFRTEALALLGMPGTPIAVAALKSAKAEPAPKGGQLAQWVAMRCGEAAFQRWLQDTFPTQWEAAHGDTPAKWGASTVRAVCGIESRAELDSNDAAAKRFHAAIRKPFEASQ